MIQYRLEVFSLFNALIFGNSTAKNSNQIYEAREEARKTKLVGCCNAPQKQPGEK